MSSELRILQLIDSLDPGGAERMAVNYANALVEFIELSALVTTRKQGALKEQVSDKVKYLFLNRKGKVGIQAVLKLRKFVKQNKIEVIHAHSTSFFVAVLVKLFYPKVKIVWHDHHGNRVNKKGNTNLALKFLSLFFNGVLTVNKELEEWAQNKLLTKKIQYFPNFISEVKSSVPPETSLKGQKGKRIVFLANLKNPKNHLKVLKAFVSSAAIQLGWTLHMIGNDYLDNYSNNLKKFIDKNNLHRSVYIYNSCADVEHILEQSDIGILGSTYEGFPVTLLEYGKANLCVISTNVGYCKEIIQDSTNGLLFDPNNRIEITQKLNLLLTNEIDRFRYAQILHNHVMTNYTDKVIINKYINWLNN